MKIKVCGLKSTQNIKSVSKLNFDFLGFIFYKKSLRYVSELNKEVLDNIPQKKVGVFVNENINKIIKIQNKWNLDLIQLHGDETAEYCQKLSENSTLIKSFLIKDDFCFNELKSYEKYVKYFLFDTYSTDYGGSGRKFNWNILSQYTLSIPFFLSGGIDDSDVETIKNINHKSFYGIDINSKFEIKPGLKNTQKIKRFVLNIKS